ncbi:hypothetical protein ACFLY5_00910, partial [Patescibacteria group bacterium]
PPFYSFLSLFLAVKLLNINAFLAGAIDTVLILWFAYQIIIAIQILIDYIFRKKFSEEDNQSKTAAGVIGIIVKGVLWVVALLMIFR